MGLARLDGRGRQGVGVSGAGWGVSAGSRFMGTSSRWCWTVARLQLRVWVSVVAFFFCPGEGGAGGRTQSIKLSLHCF